MKKTRKQTALAKCVLATIMAMGMMGYTTVWADTPTPSPVDKEVSKDTAGQIYAAEAHNATGYFWTDLGHAQVQIGSGEKIELFTPFIYHTHHGQWNPQGFGYIPVHKGDNSEMQCKESMAQISVGEFDRIIKSLYTNDITMAKTIYGEAGQAGLKDTVIKAYNSAYIKAQNKNIDIILEILKDYQIVHDNKWTEEAIFNVIDNGIKYTEPGGKIIITMEESLNFIKINIEDTDIKLETLSNMLAIDNGGIEINPQDYTHLFASIIKKGLIPNKEIFKIADLSRMLETEAQITQLPPDEIIKIAKDVNRNRAIGLEDEKIGLELTRKIQGAKLKIVDDLQETKILLDNEQKEKDWYKNKADKSTSAFKRQIEKEEKKKYRNSIRNVKIIFFIAVPISLLLISAIIFYIFKNTTINSLTGYIFGVITDLCVFALTSFFVAIPKVRKMPRDKDLVVSENIRKRLEEELN